MSHPSAHHKDGGDAKHPSSQNLSAKAPHPPPQGGASPSGRPNLVVHSPAGHNAQPEKTPSTHSDDLPSPHAAAGGKKRRDRAVVTLAGSEADGHHSGSHVSQGGSSSGDVSPSSSSPHPPGGHHHAQLVGDERDTSHDAKPTPQRQSANAMKAKRREFFEPLEHKGPWNTLPRANGVKCTWLASIAVGLSFATGRSVSIEEILKKNSMALHYVAFPSVTLAELFDNVDEFIKASPPTREGEHAVRCEVATFDTETIEEVSTASSPAEVDLSSSQQIVASAFTGQHAPVTSLVAFRKELASALADDSHSMFLINFDPFVVQEAEARVENAALELDDEDQSPTTKPAESSVPKQWTAKNQGHFAVLKEYNAALHTVAIEAVYVKPDGSFICEPHSCPIQTLYNALCARDGYSRRARGYVRIFRPTDKQQFQTQIVPKFPIALLDGKKGRGMLSIALDIAIAPHILGLALLHNVLKLAILKVADGKEETLRGIPVTDIAMTLQLPLGVVTAPANRESLLTAYSWYRTYLQRKKLADKVFSSVTAMYRRDDAEDGAANVNEEDFVQFLRTAVSDPNTVLMVNFNVEIAQNVKMLDTGVDPSHFALVVGFDPQHHLVQLADVSVKKFRKVWYTSDTMLYNACIGYGFMAVSTDKAVVEKLTATSHRVDRALASAKFKLPPAQAVIPFSYYAKKNYSLVTVSRAFNLLLGAEKVTTEKILLGCGIHISFVASEHLPLFAIERVASFYCQRALTGADAAHVVATAVDDVESQTNDFKRDLVASLKPAAGTESTTRVVVNFASASLAKIDAVWNGGSGGNAAVVVGYDAERDVALLEDANFEPFYRTWECPTAVLMRLMAEKDTISERPRGWLTLRRGADARWVSRRGYDLRASMQHHPFKPPVSSAGAVIALAASVLCRTPYSLEDVVYSSRNFDIKALSQATGFDSIVLMAKDFAATVVGANLRVAERKAISAEELVTLFGHELTVTLIVYDVAALFPKAAVPAGLTGAALLDRVNPTTGEVLLCDGNPIAFGSHVIKSAAEVVAACTGVLCFTL